MRRTIIGLIAGVALGVVVAPAAAQTFSDGFTYQGVLNDNGQPANGAYDLEFRIFDSIIGGSQVSPNLILPNQAVTDGLITQQLEFGPGIFDGSRRFLEIRVRPVGGGAFTTLPRQEIRATPHAVFAKSSEVSGFAMTSGTTLQDAFDNGSVIDVDGETIGLANSANGSDVQIVAGDGFNDAIRLLNSDGEGMFTFAEDFDGGGGFFSVSDGLSSQGLFIDGNAFGSTSARLVINGASSIELDSSSTGNASVEFPVDAISPAETSAEAGVVHSPNGSFSNLVTATGVVAVNSRTITPPANGFVVAIASAQFFIDHVAGTDSAVNLSVSPIEGQVIGNNRARSEIDGSIASDVSYSQSLISHDVFPVSAGVPTTVFVNVSASGGGTGTDVNASQLTLLFVPTAYGVVSREPGSALREVDSEVEATPTLAVPLTAADIAAERDASIAANLARMEAEMAQMRAEIEALRSDRGQNGPAKR